MGFLHSQNLTLGLSQPEVAHTESTSQLLSSVNNTVIVLGVLTFALQLCLVLFFMLRCWRFDNRVREALKHPDTEKKLVASSSLYQYICKQGQHQLFDDADADAAAASTPAVPAAAEECVPFTHPLFAPYIPWDLVQR